MKKVVLATVCGLCLFAGIASLSNVEDTFTVAGSGGHLHIKV